MDNGLNVFYHSKVFNDVINGKFPKDAVKKMNICRLQGLVVNLVKYTSVKAGTKSVSMVNPKNKPRWWPRDVLFEFDSLSSEVKTREFRVTLQQLVIKCCEFFRNKSFKQIWLPANRTESAWINDENFNSVKTRGIKRKRDLSEVSGVKNRKTLTSKNETALRVQQNINRPVKAIVYLHDIFKTPKKPDPVTQQQFLESLGLSLNNNSTTPISPVPQGSKLIKLHHCPHIPISSDIGKAIIKRENYVVPEYSTAKKIERLEWYVNRNPPKKTPQHYEVTFVNNKVSDFHVFKFPRKRFHQCQEYTNFVLKQCKPLKVVLDRIDVPEKVYRDNTEVTVVLQRLSAEQLSKYVCKNIKVYLTRKVASKRRRLKPQKLSL